MEVDALVGEYRSTYRVGAEHDRADSLRDAARIELGLKAFLEEGGSGAFSDTFEDLHGAAQLPGIASQRMMAAATVSRAKATGRPLRWYAL